MITASKNVRESLGFVMEQRVNGVIAKTDTEPTMTTTQQAEIPATQNEAWGLFGTLGEHADAAWPIAMTAISDATYQPLANLKDAIHAATQRWMGWTIGRQTSKQYGFPRGLPYLTGFVIHCEIVEEAMAD